MTTLDTALGWYARIYKNVTLNIPLQFQYHSAYRVPASFELLLPLEMEMRAKGRSPAEFSLDLPMSMHFASPSIRSIMLDFPMSMGFSAVERYTKEFELTLPLLLEPSALEHYQRSFELNVPLAMEMQVHGINSTEPQIIVPGGIGSGTGNYQSAYGTDHSVGWWDNIPQFTDCAIVDFWWGMYSEVGEQIPQFDVRIGGQPLDILADVSFFVHVTGNDATRMHFRLVKAIVMDPAHGYQPIVIRSHTNGVVVHMLQGTSTYYCNVTDYGNVVTNSHRPPYSIVWEQLAGANMPVPYLDQCKGVHFGPLIGGGAGGGNGSTSSGAGGGGGCRIEKYWFERSRWTGTNITLERATSVANTNNGQRTRLVMGAVELIANGGQRGGNGSLTNTGGYGPGGLAAATGISDLSWLQGGNGADDGSHGFGASGRDAANYNDLRPCGGGCGASGVSGASGNGGSNLVAQGGGGRGNNGESGFTGGDGGANNGGGGGGGGKQVGVGGDGGYWGGGGGGGGGAALNAGRGGYGAQGHCRVEFVY